jgi:integrase
VAYLTVRGIEALKARKKGYKVTVDRDLYLRVSTDGTKTWLVRYVVDGRQKQATLPRRYSSDGDAAHMSLAQAIAENTRIQALARDGIDFQIQRVEAEQERAAAKAAERAAKIAEETANAPFRMLFETWLAEGVSRADDNAELKRTFEKDVLPTLGAIPVREISDANLLHVLRKVGRGRGRGRTAERMLTETRQMFRWAIKRQPWRSILEQGNPAELVEVKQVVPKDYSPGIVERTLSFDEIRELKHVFEEMQSKYDSAENRRVAVRPLQKESQLALWICLGTACRIGELLKTRWKNVDLKRATWFIPKEDTKTKVDWLVYLSDFSLGQFKALHALTGKTDYCFPARDPTQHVDVKSVSKQVGDRQICFKQRKTLSHRRNDNALVLADGKNGEWTPHDLRRTAATLMQALGISPDVIDRCQNHVLPGRKVRRHYLLHDYADEKRFAWNLLGQHIEMALTEQSEGYDFMEVMGGELDINASDVALIEALSAFA